jgi:hypothetical protein
MVLESTGIIDDSLWVDEYGFTVRVMCTCLDLAKIKRVVVYKLPYEHSDNYVMSTKKFLKMYKKVEQTQG